MNNVEDWNQIYFCVAVVTVFVFFFIKNQIKERKELSNYTSELDKGKATITINSNINA